MSTKTFPSTGNQVSSKDEVLNLLSVGDATQKKQAAQKQPAEQKETASKDDVLDLLSGTVKKKDTGSESSNGASQFSSPSPEAEAAAGNAYANKSLTEKDFDILANSDWGKKQGLASISPDLKSTFVRANNGSTRKDLVDNVVKNVIDEFYPNSSDPQQSKARSQIMQSVLIGNQDDIAKVKNNVVQSLQKQIDDVNSQSARRDDRFGKVYTYSPPQKNKIDELNAKMKNVVATMDEWGINALVNSPETKEFVDIDANHPNILTSVAASKLGSEIRKRYGLNNPSGNMAYEESKEGLGRIIQNKKMQANELLKNGLLSKNPDAIKQAQGLISEIDRYSKWYGKLDTEQFPDVGITHTAQFLGDIISDQHPGKWIVSKDDVDEAAKIAEEKNPGWNSKYGQFLGYLEQHPMNVPAPGLGGGLERGGAKAVAELLKSRADIFGYDKDKEQLENFERSPALKGTAASGLAPAKILYDKEGKSYRELPNEHYNQIDFNNGMRFIGESLPSLAAWVAAEETGVGIAKGLGAGKNVARGAGLLTAAYATGFDNNRKLADQLIDDESGLGDAKKNILANVLTASTAAVFKMLDYSPSKMVQSAISKSVGPDLIKMLEENGFEKLSEKQTANFIKESVLPRAKAIVSKVGENLQGGAKLGVASVIDQKVKDFASIISNPNANVSTGEDNLKTIGSQMLLMSIVGLPGVISEGFSPSAKDNLYEVGTRSPQYIEHISDMLDRGEIDQSQANNAIALAKTAAEEVGKAQHETNDKGLPLTIKQKKEVVAANVKKRAGDMLKESGVEVKGTSSDAEIKDVKKQESYLPIEDTETFKSIKSIAGEKPKMIDDIDPKKEYQYLKDGEPVQTDGATLIDHLQNGDIYEKEPSATTEGKIPESEITTDENQEPTEGQKAKAVVNKALESRDIKGVYRTEVQRDPVAFLKEVSNQITGTTADGIKSLRPDAEIATRIQFGDDVVDAAKEMFPISEPKIKTNEEINNEKNVSLTEGGQSGQVENREKGQQQNGEKNETTGILTPNQGAASEPAPSSDLFRMPEGKEKIGFEDFRQQALDMYDKPLSKWDWRVTSDMSTKDRIKGVADIRAGKNSAAARRVESEIKKMHDEGSVPMNKGDGPQTQNRDWSFEELSMLQDAVKEVEPHIADWLRGEKELTPEEEQLINDNIDNLIQDYGTTETTGENQQSPTETETASGASDSETAGGKEGAGNEATGEGAGQPPSIEEIAHGEQEPGKPSIKNETIRQERLERGLGELESQLGKTTYEMAKNAVDKGEILPVQLVQEMLVKPRALYPMEYDALRYYKEQLLADQFVINKEIAEANSTGDEGKLTDAVARRGQLEDARNDLEIALRKSGTASGESLQKRADDKRNRSEDEDYTLENQVQAMRDANLGNPITPELRAKLERYDAQLKDATRKLEEHQQKIDQLEKEKAERNLKRDAEFEERKEKRSGKKERIQAERKNLIQELKDIAKEQRSRLSANPIPVEMIPTLAKLAKNFIKEGITDLAQIADNIHKEIKDLVDGVSVKDVQDVLSDYDNQIRLEAYKKRVGGDTKKLVDRINKGDFTLKKKPPLKLDREAEQLLANKERIKRKFDSEKFKLEQKQRTGLDKVMDWFTKWHRFDLLSGITTLGKLGTAAFERTLITPIEEITGAGIGLIGKGAAKLIGNKALDIASQAPREGGFNAKAEAKALSQYVQKATYQDMLQMVKEGKNPMELLFGKKYDLPSEAIGFFGQLHSALKIIPKRNEFVRGVEKRMEWRSRNGFDVNNPEVQMAVYGEAYNDSMRSIFMQDNMISDAYKVGLNYLDSKGEGGKIASFIMRNLLPIIKVPTNIVGEAASYAAGGIKAAVIARKQLYGGIKLMMGMKSGVDKLTPDQADFVMRNLKKQTIGSAFMALGYFGAYSVGGYYTGKRAEGDVEEGGLRIFDTDIPKWMVHNPALEMLQLGATIRRVQDSYEIKGKENATEAGIVAGAKGIAEQVPFFNLGGQLDKAIASDKGVNKFTDEFIKSTTVPVLLQEFAKWTDTDSEGNMIKRKPGDLVETIETGIPVLRQNVPEKNPKNRPSGWGGGAQGDF